MEHEINRKRLSCLQGLLASPFYSVYILHEPAQQPSTAYTMSQKKLSRVSVTTFDFNNSERIARRI